MTSGSIGLQNEKSKDIIFLFMTRDALNSFRNSKGWSVGESVPLLKLDVDKEIHRRMVTAPVEAIVLTNSGVMGDVSVSGINVSRMLARSGRLPQLTQITGTPLLRAIGNRRCSGAIGARSAP